MLTQDSLDSVTHCVQVENSVVPRAAPNNVSVDVYTKDGLLNIVLWLTVTIPIHLWSPRETGYTYLNQILKSCFLRRTHKRDWRKWGQDSSVGLAAATLYPLVQRCLPYQHLLSQKLDTWSHRKHCSLSENKRSYSSFP